MIIIPSQDLKLGDKVKFQGVELEAAQEYVQGNEAKNSGLTYFMHTNKGVMGFKEVEPLIIDHSRADD